MREIRRKDRLMKKVLLTALNAKYIHSNLAVYDLRAYANKYMEESAKEEISIDYIEFTINHQLDDILQELYRKKPDVLCFSCYIWNISYITSLVPELKKILPKLEIWLGGPEVSYHAGDFMEKLPELRGIIRGEGEAAFTRICNQYAKELPVFEEIGGITVRTENGICETGQQEPVSLSDIPFVYEEIGEISNRILYYESSRGCPFSCSYCLSSVEETVRFRDMELVKKELQYFIDHEVPQVKFVDRTFNCKKSHAMQIWSYIQEHDRGKTNFHFEIGADLLDDEALELLAGMRPGLIQFEIGVQSVNEKTIREISRKMNLERLEYVVQTLRRQQNINLHLDLIAGLPYEALESFQTSFDRIYRLYPEQLQLGFLKVLYGSSLEWNQKKYGIVHKSEPPYEVLYTDWLSYEDVLVLKMVEQMVELYYNSGQFTYTLRFLEHHFARPFALYESLGRYYEAHFEKGVKHNRMDRYHILRAYAAGFLDEEAQKQLDQIMNFDLYLRENSKQRPAFAVETGSYKKLFHDVRETCELTQREHVEIISIDVWKTLEQLDVSVEKRSTDLQAPMGYVMVYFDYQQRNVLNNNGKVYQLVC